MKLAIYIRPGRTDERVQAFCPDLLGCSAVGSTVEEALARVKERVEAFFGEMRQRPLPADTRRVDIEI